MEITVPFLKEPVGAGDLVKAATSAMGVKPCGGCQKRAEAFNRALNFTPTAQTVSVTPPAQWTAPPEVPEGWEMEDSCGAAGLYLHVKSGRRIVWNIAGGKYSFSHSFCCSAAQARAELAKRCQP